MGLLLGIGNIEKVEFNKDTGFLTVTYKDGHKDQINLSILKTDISGEAQTRAAADADLLSRINTEIQRAKAAEAATNTHLAAEIIRAKKAESDLLKAIQSSSGIDEERERAEAAETALNNAIEALRNNQNQTAGQITDLSDELKEEASRAQTAEIANAADIATEQERAEKAESNLKAEIDRIAHKDDREQRWSYKVISGNYEVTPANEKYLDLFVKIGADYTVIYIDPENTLIGEIIVLRVENPDAYKFRIRSGKFDDWREVLGIEKNLTKGEIETIFSFKVLTESRLQLLSITDVPDTEAEPEEIFDITFDETFD